MKTLGFIVRMMRYKNTPDDIDTLADMYDRYTDVVIPEKY
jgi:hypothetical protein